MPAEVQCGEWGSCSTVFFCGQNERICFKRYSVLMKAIALQKPSHARVVLIAEICHSCSWKTPHLRLTLGYVHAMKSKKLKWFEHLPHWRHISNISCIYVTDLGVSLPFQDRRQRRCWAFLLQRYWPPRRERWENCGSLSRKRDFWTTWMTVSGSNEAPSTPHHPINL